MALVTGQPIPEHLPYTQITANVANIPNYLGVIEANPTAAATYTLPLMGSSPPILSGASLVVRNISRFPITLVPSGGNAVVGSASMVVNPAYTAQLISSGSGNWAFVSNPQVEVSVLDYGAKGDGVTDDTVAIQAAFTRNVGKIIYFPAGTYMISALSLTGNTSIYGVGRASVIKRIVGIAPGATSMLLVTSTTNGCSITGLCFQNIANAIGAGLGFDNCINVTNCANVNVKDCYFSIGLRSAVYAVNCVGCEFTGNNVYEYGDNPVNPVVNDQPNVAIAFFLVDSCSDCNVSYNRVAAGGCGVGFQAITAGSILVRCSAIGNIINNCSTYGIFVYDNNLNNGGLGYVRNCNVNDNVVSNVYGSILISGLKNAGAGIYIQGCQFTSVVGNTVDNVAIQTNSFTLQPAGIAVGNATAFTITGNSISNPNQMGIYSANSNNFNLGGAGVIANNSINCIAATTSAILIADSINVAVIGNSIQGMTQYGIRTIATTTGNFRIAVTNNLLNATATTLLGISMDVVTDSRVSGNTLVNSTAVSGVGIGVGLTSSTRTIISNNNVRLFAVGIRLYSASGSNTLSGNYVNGAPQCYFLDSVTIAQDFNGGFTTAAEIYFGNGSPINTQVVSANTIGVAMNPTLIRIDGTPGPTVNSIGTPVRPGQVVTIANVAAGAGNITFTYAAATLKLAGSVNLVLTPSSNVTFMAENVSGTILWREIGRCMA